MSDVTLFVDGSSGAPELERNIADLMSKAFNIWKQRQRKYGTGNISRRGPVGILVRLDDKAARLDRVFVDGVGGSEADETVEDTCLDIVNYALMVNLCHQGKWPGWTPRHLVATPKE